MKQKLEKALLLGTLTAVLTSCGGDSEKESSPHPKFNQTHESNLNSLTKALEQESCSKHLNLALSRLNKEGKFFREDAKNHLNKFVSNGCDIYQINEEGKDAFFASVALASPRSLDLVELGIDPNKTYEGGYSAFHMLMDPLKYTGFRIFDDTFLADRYKTVRDLSFYEFDPNIQDTEGNTPLHILACSSGNPLNDKEVATLMIEEGADPHIRNLEGKTAIQLSEECNREDLL